MAFKLGITVDLDLDTKVTVTWQMKNKIIVELIISHGLDFENIHTA